MTEEKTQYGKLAGLALAGFLLGWLLSLAGGKTASTEDKVIPITKGKRKRKKLNGSEA
jgi:hypothetical protein